MSSVFAWLALAAAILFFPSEFYAAPVRPHYTVAALCLLVGLLLGHIERLEKRVREQGK